MDFDAESSRARATMVLNELQESILRTEAARPEQGYPKADGFVRTDCSVASGARLRQDSNSSPG